MRDRNVGVGMRRACVLAAIGAMGLAGSASAAVETFSFHVVQGRRITQTCSPRFAGGLFPLAASIGSSKLSESADQTYAFFTGHSTFIRAESLGDQVCFIASARRSERVSVQLQEVSFGAPEQIAG